MAPVSPPTAARELRTFLRHAGARTPGAAAAALEALHAVVPADCAALSRWDPVARRHVTLAATYPAAAVAVIDDRMHADPLFADVRRTRVPVRVRDLPRRQRRGELFETLIDPLGFRDGLTLCLFAADGRYVGVLNASTLDPRHPDDDVVAILDLLAADLGAALDPLPSAVARTSALASGDAEGLLVPASGPVTALSPGARPDLVAPGSPLLRLVAAVLAGDPAPTGTLHVLVDGRVQAVDLQGGPSGVVVLHREVDAPRGLTPRELQVLDALSRGRTNAEIARALGVAPRTVATHVEHVLARTGCPNRVAAARLATRWGLLTRP
ncbi:hypothetical protein GCM10017691_61330 [Pseudonocardia petroleophila]